MQTNDQKHIIIETLSLQNFYIDVKVMSVLQLSIQDVIVHDNLDLLSCLYMEVYSVHTSMQTYSYTQHDSIEKIISSI